MFSPPPDALPAKKSSLSGRRLVLVDIENVAGGAVHTNQIAIWARAQVEREIQLRQDEPVIIGVSHLWALPTYAAWPGARLLVRSGQDGADLELQGVLRGESLERRFDKVVLVSGDGIFAEDVARLAATGVHVTVAACGSSMSKRLRLSASVVVELAQPSAQFGGAA